jgi:general stress protein 26
MYETAAELESLQALLDRSHASATGHLRDIINADRVLNAEHVVGLLTGMKVISVATVTKTGEPRISAMDGHFLHGTWSFSTSGTAAKAKHLERNPAVSVAHVDGEVLAVFSHGRAEALRESDPEFPQTLEHWTNHYGSSPFDWGPDIRFYRYTPHFMIGYAAERERLLAERGVG